MQEQRGTPLTRAESASPSTARRRATLVWVVLAASVLIDQGTKWWALRDLEPGVTHPLIDGLLSLRLIRNPGAAFSMLDGMTYVVTAIAVGIVIRILHLAHTRLLSRGYAWILGLVAGGAIGNLLDRFLREPGVGRGHVVDFIDYGGMFVGNVADIVIVLAAAAFAAYALRGIRLDGTRES